MKKLFTLIYFVNKFQTKGSSRHEVENVIENSLALMAFEPSERSIKNILDFACSYEVIETRETGYVELNLN